MEAGAAFLVLLIVVCAAIVGGLFWILSSTLRRRKLNLREDKIDSQLLGRNGAEQATQTSPNGHAQEGPRPEHHRVENEQQAHPVPRR